MAPGLDTNPTPNNDYNKQLTLKILPELWVFYFQEIKIQSNQNRPRVATLTLETSVWETVALLSKEEGNVTGNRSEPNLLIHVPMAAVAICVFSGSGPFLFETCKY